jgi:acetyltransferase-like isoleucine patch superfamily enzyme
LLTNPEGSEGSQDHWDGADPERRDYEPWLVVYDEQPGPERVERLVELGGRAGYDLDPRSFVATDAHVVAERLSLGEGSFIAAGCVIRGDVSIGSHCSLNAGTVTIGRVSIGDLVRIASYAVLVGENHVFDDPGLPIAAQGLSSTGIVIEDDVWIGAHVTIVDGVTVGSHSVVAAGAVVTRDVEPWSVVAGVPARVVKHRQRDGGPRLVRGDALSMFDRIVAEQWPAVLERCQIRHEGVDTYVDKPGDGWGPRPLDDAIEIAGAFGELPPVSTREELIDRIQAAQDPETGLFVDPRVGPPTEPLAFTDHEWDMYGLLSCGYALEVLGAGPRHPVHVIEDCSAERLEELLDALDWGYVAWGSGAWVDGFGTGAYLNRRHHGSTRTHAMLWGWLATHVHRDSGLWGTYLDPLGDWDPRWLMAVNGYYRLTRGTYAQFGVAVPHPETAVDTVVAHCRDYRWFTCEERNACNVLDVIHPLWMLSRQTEYRRAEIRDGAATILRDATGDWIEGQGVPWHVGHDQPGLQGTEMWLSVVYLAADLLGESAGLSWSPRGVHRLEPATTLG